MKAVFLCGGDGRRMFPVSEDKFLLDFLGKTLLEHQLELAASAGLTEFVIVGNPRNIDAIESISAGTPGARIDLAIQKEPSGIAGALESARRFLDGEIIVVNPNDIFELSAYTGLLEAHRGNPAASYLAGCEVSDYFPGGYLVVGEENELKRIVEKPGRGNEPSNLVNILVHLHSDPERLLKYIADVRTGRDDVYECALGAIARDTRHIRVVPYTGAWDAIKYPWHIFAAVRGFLDRSQGYISPSARISGKATIEGKVIISDNVRVFENAVIRGPVYIGPGTIIGNSSLVREYSHIGARCVVGFSTEVKTSYVGDDCWFHMSYAGDSIIGSGCSFGAGTVLSNFRFDEGNISVKVEGEPVDTGLDKLGAIIGSNCKTGVNANVMPGIKIGSGSIVGAHVCLTDDLPPGKVARAPGNYKVMDNNYHALPAGR